MTTKQSITALRKENHNLFKLIDKQCINQNDNKCDICIHKCKERLQINANIDTIKILMAGA